MLYLELLLMLYYYYSLEWQFLTDLVPFRFLVLIWWIGEYICCGTWYYWPAAASTDNSVSKFYYWYDGDLFKLRLMPLLSFKMLRYSIFAKFFSTANEDYDDVDEKQDSYKTFSETTQLWQQLVKEVIPTRVKQNKIIKSFRFYFYTC